MPQLFRMPSGGVLPAKRISSQGNFDPMCNDVEMPVTTRRWRRAWGQAATRGKRRVTSEAGTAVGDAHAMPGGTSHAWGHSRSRFFQCHNYVFDNLLVRPARCGIKDRFWSVSSTCDVVEADVHREWSEILTLNQNRAVALGTFALAHDAEALGHFSVGFQEAAEVAAEAVLVEFLARLDVPQPA
jgi:hypothetical protein